MTIFVSHLRHPRRHTGITTISIVSVPLEEKGSWESLFPCMTAEEVCIELQARWIHSSIHIASISQFNTIHAPAGAVRTLSPLEFANCIERVHIKPSLDSSTLNEQSIVTERKYLAWQKLFSGMNACEVIAVINTTWIDPLFELILSAAPPDILFPREEASLVS